MEPTHQLIRPIGMGALALLIFPVSGLLASKATTGEVVITLTAVAVFAGTFVWVWLHIPSTGAVPAGRLAIAALAALALGVNLADPDKLRWGTLFVYLAVAAGLVLPAREGLGVAALTPLLGLAAVLATYPSLSLDRQHDLRLTTPQALLELLVVGLGAVGVRRLIETTVALQSARTEIAHLAVEQERHRFARDLHDILGHTLSLIAIKGELAGRLLPDRADAAATEIRDIERVARDALREVRDTVTGYRQVTLATELAGARAVLEAASIECRIRNDAGPLPSATESVFAWAVREGATNVVRHSRATSCIIEIEQRGDTASIQIDDDGIGGRAGLGNGLHGLAERVASCGGHIDAGQLPGRGFRLRVTSPGPLAEPGATSPERSQEVSQ